MSGGKGEVPSGKERWQKEGRGARRKGWVTGGRERDQEERKGADVGENGNESIGVGHTGYNNHAVITQGCDPFSHDGQREASISDISNVFPHLLCLWLP